MKHSEASLGARHPVHNWEYADAAARTSATGFTANDIYKVALQLDDNSTWLLIATTPTWVSLGGGSGPSTTDDLPEGSTNLYYTEGRVSANTDVSANTTHRGLTNNPHSTDIGNLGGGTLAELNSAVSDATLDDSGDPRDPNAHASTHQDGGSDEISVANLSGVLADKQDADKIQARDVAATAPTANQVLTWSTGNNRWEPADPPGAGGGESNTASNQGTAGVGLFDTKVGVDLQFKNINAGSNKVSVTDDGANKEVDIDVVPGNLVHQDLSGAGTNDHSAIDSHISSTANPHSTDIGNLGSGTLSELNAAVSDATLDDVSGTRDPNAHALGGAEHTASTLAALNTKVSDATLDDSGDPRDPNAHATTHQDGGSDELNVGGLSGTLADPQTPSSHASTHQNGGADEISVANLSGVLADRQDADQIQGRDVQDATPSDGDVLVWSLSNTRWQPEAQGASASVFGLDYQTASSAARSTTTSTTPQTKTSLTTPALTGTYRVAWHAVADHSSASARMASRLQNTTDATTIGAEQIHEPKDTNNRIGVGGFSEVEFTGAAKTFEIQYYVVTSGTAGIQDARIEIWRVA